MLALAAWTPPIEEHSVSGYQNNCGICGHGGFDLAQMENLPKAKGPITNAHRTIDPGAYSICKMYPGIKCSDTSLCQSYWYNGYHYGEYYIYYCIDNTAVAAGLEALIEQCADTWNKSALRDGSGNIAYLERVSNAYVNGYDGAAVCNVTYDSKDGGTTPGTFDYYDAFSGDFEVNKLLQITIYSNGKTVKTIAHEFGHLLGLADLDTSASQLEPNHNSLMGYGTATKIEYQDIQGASLYNLRHTSHTFTRYEPVIENGTYQNKHLCFYCNGYAYGSLGGSPMVTSTHTCDYQPMATSGERYWSRCTLCYEVLECPIGVVGSSTYTQSVTCAYYNEVYIQFLTGGDKQLSLTGSYDVSFTIYDSWGNVSGWCYGNDSPITLWGVTADETYRLRLYGDNVSAVLTAQNL